MPLLPRRLAAEAHSWWAPPLLRPHRPGLEMAVLNLTQTGRVISMDAPSASPGAKRPSEREVWRISFPYLSRCPFYLLFKCHRNFPGSHFHFTLFVVVAVVSIGV
jgi:hypothetical protein